MSDNINEKKQAGRFPRRQDSVVDVEEALKRLKIRPRKVLGSLSHLRIDRARVKPVDHQAPKAGGNADVEAAILASQPSSSSSEHEEMQYVAIKKLRLDERTDDDRALAPLAHEVHLLNDLDHENVVKIVGFVEDVEQGIAWMVFAWEKNGNLREFIRSTNWELPERVSLLFSTKKLKIHDVATGLSYLHGKHPPICHGDLKSVGRMDTLSFPRLRLTQIQLNILVSSENRAVITDFGSACAKDPVAEEELKSIREVKTSTTPHKTAAGTPTMGELTAEMAPSGDFVTMTGPAWTVRWAAPELLDGDLPGLASDIWALGWICWEAVTGNFPFDKEHEIAVVTRVTQGDLPTIETDDHLKQIKALCSLMRECWKLDTSERPTAMRCRQVVSWMDRIIPSHREGSSSSVTRSSGLLHALGQIQLGNSMWTEAREYFEQSLKVAESVGDEWSIATALKAIGRISYLRDDYSEAEALYSRARDIYSQIGNQLGFSQAIEGLGRVYYVRDEYSGAEELYTQARDIYLQIGDQLGVAQSVASLGDVYRVRGEYSKAEESYIQARDVYLQVGDQTKFALTLCGLGGVYCMRDEYSKAEDSYIRARDIFSQIGNQICFAESITGLGDLYKTREEYFKAEESYIQARDIYSQIGEQAEFAQSLSGLGDVYRERDEYSKAEELYVQARDIFSQIGNQVGVADSVYGLGEVYRMRDQHSKAEEAFVQARHIYTQVEHPFGLAQSIEGMGRVHSARGEHSMAEASYLEAQRLYQRIGQRRALADIAWHLSGLHREQHQYEAAERLVREASTTYAGLGLDQYVDKCDQFLEEIHLLLK
ncbi:hypothetical protein FS837_005445 [Tulasnella sp. UAMH 9824]|nr:hypothetical protein FS837_005445 [Tulasnella sp. UAMH 9824]